MSLPYDTNLCEKVIRKLDDEIKSALENMADYSVGGFCAALTSYSEARDAALAAWERAFDLESE